MNPVIVPEMGTCYVVDATDTAGDVHRGLARWMGKTNDGRDLWQSHEGVLSAHGIVNLIVVLMKVTIEPGQDLIGEAWE